MNAPAFDLQAIEAVAFDLDGTLVDSAPDIRHALNTALRTAGLQVYELDAVRAWIGDGPDTLILRAMAAQGLSPDDAELRTRLRRSFDMATLAAPLAYGKVYEGMQELVISLHGRFPLAVVSNKPTALSRAVLDAAQLLGRMTSVHGADTAELRKPKPGMLLAAADKLGVSPSRLLMVGDSPADMGAALAAGCPAALVGWGYGAHAVADELPGWRVATPSQLLGMLVDRSSSRQNPEHQRT